MLSADELRQAASDLSSPDLGISMEARKKMMTLLQPDTVVSLCQSAEEVTALQGLLGEVAQNGVTEVHTVIGGALARLFCDSASGAAVVTDSKCSFIITFVVTTLCHDDIAIANTARGPVLAMMRTADGCGAAAAAPWTIMDEHLRCAAVLRLFNCDAIDSLEVNDVCRWLLAHTSLAQFILDETCHLFTEDILSLFNYLVVCGALSHHTTLPERLQNLVRTALEMADDDLTVAATCRFCSVALRGSETNARTFGSQWISRSLKALRMNRAAVEDAVFDMIGSSSTTPAGWSAALESGMESSVVSDSLTSFSNTSRCTGLHLVLVLLESTFVEDSFFSEAVLQQAWSLRTNPEEEIRLAVWRTMTLVMSKEALRKSFIAIVASNLCGASSYDDSVTVRAAQLAVTHKLLTLNALPNTTREALTARAEKGLYPPGSAGVAAMTRD